MVRKIVKYGDPVLRKKCPQVREVTDEIRTLATDMIETMKAANGVGLAAPQVGVSWQLGVIDVSHDPECISFLRVNGEPCELSAIMPLVFLNPTLTMGRDKIRDQEGCLSFPDLRGDIIRADEVKAEFETLDGERMVVETDGLLSRALQHETDHLNGILFIDRMSAGAKIGLKRKLRFLQEEWAMDEESS
jgi:peptide deformylase